MNKHIIVLIERLLFCELANPLGLGHKAMPLACKVQNLLIADFLHYLALRHDVYLSTASSARGDFVNRCAVLLRLLD